ncbi:hypothetical protein [Nonomuraea dietziae]|uniref:hypothetical protein n=1 Tax=Nonomuraea dietziae TaxID=65515 RepID=UPI00340D0D40
MADKKKSHVKGHYRKRPGGGRTWVAPHTRTSRGKKALAGSVLLVAALVGWAVFAKSEGQAPAARTDLKVVQAMLGHASIVLTADTYVSVLPEVAHRAAMETARLVLSAASALGRPLGG